MKAKKAATTAVAAATLIAFGLPLSASAAAPSQFEKVSVTVAYNDLNIESYSGAKALYARLQRASRKACNFRAPSRALSAREATQSRRCYSNTLEAAVNKIDSETLAEVHNS